MSIPSDNIAPTADPAVEYLKKVYRHGMLVVLLSLVAFNVYWLISLPPGYDSPRYTNLLVVGALLMNHLASSVPWKKPADKMFRTASRVTLVLAGLYILNAFCKWF
jgi:hypothetical protein